METQTRTNPFYELYDRLYAAAAAGTAVISEDFRLRRAVDAFAPMAEKNKVFARLHSMCTGLFTAEDAPAVLADCIALADALAVTQGSFLDSFEVRPAECFPGFAPHDIPYSELTALKDVISRAKNSTKPAPSELTGYASDPRLVREFIKNCDSNSENLGRLARVFIGACGSSLTKPLIESIDMDDPKAVGRQIEFVSEIEGEKLNDLYRRLAFDENAPVGVRAKAIAAMGLSEENTEDLIELFRTAGGKLSTAALEAIAEISPPQAEPIFEQLANKFKASYTAAFSVAKYPVCSRLARSELDKWMKEKPGHEFPVRIANMLCNKTDVFDCFYRMAQKGQEYGGYAQLLERILLADMTRNSDPDYKAMTDQLYREFPDTMFFTKLVSDILVKGDAAFDLPSELTCKYIGTFGYLLDNISAEEDGYHISMWNFEGAPKLKDTVLFKRIPDKLLRILADTPYKTKDRNDKRNYSLLSFVRKCVPEDTERVRNAAVTFALDSFKREPGFDTLYLLEENDRLPNGAITDIIIYYAKKYGKLSYYYYTTMYSRFKYPERVPAELKTAARLIEGMKKELPRQSINDMLSDINKALDHIERNKK